MKTPCWWYRKSIVGVLLAPLGWMYGFASRLRARTTTPKKAAIPVICIGNVVAGGGGKTPVALALGAWCKAQNIQAFFISRGYGAKLQRPMLVTPQHSAGDVGDESLLLASVLPTIVSPNRFESIRLAVAKGALLAILDDGFQNPSVAKDLNLLVLKGDMPLGNGRLIPAGPLRESLKAALKRAQAVVWVDPPARPNLSISLPLFTAVTKLALPEDVKKVAAFAGIARPELFCEGLKKAGVEVAAFTAFADHHVFTNVEIRALLAKAEHENMPLVTTEKDWVRLPEELKSHVVPVALNFAFEDSVVFERWLSAHVPSSARRSK